MRFATRLSALLVAMVLGCVAWAGAGLADVRSEVLRKAALEAGVLAVPPPTPAADPAEVELGRRLFEDKRLSLNARMSCRVCHLDRFSSADGLPNAVGVGGDGEGTARAMSDGLIVPRNTLPLWGRGGPGFTTFFWDGKVEQLGGRIISQFGDRPPSSDPLIVAVHLPFVELREMVRTDPLVARKYVKEDVDTAEELLVELTRRVIAEPDYVELFGRAYGLGAKEIRFVDIAKAIATFIRVEFALRESRLSRFLAGTEALSEDEVAGGLIFYGKGRCGTCHSGPYYSDFGYHAVPIGQIGFGKNGFGVDYGRFNVTHDPVDLYRFRTPPLVNVSLTGPYGHSGSARSLEEAITAHFDPLRNVSGDQMDAFARTEFYKRLLASSPDSASIVFLGDDDVAVLVQFLGTLTIDNSH